jgi:hypothetical protein
MEDGRWMLEVGGKFQSVKKIISSSLLIINSKFLKGLITKSTGSWYQVFGFRNRTILRGANSWEIQVDQNTFNESTCSG